MFASYAFSTLLWQYRQSMPSLPAWIWWLNPPPGCVGMYPTLKNLGVA